jgi:hypothetical protein
MTDQSADAETAGSSSDDDVQEATGEASEGAGDGDVLELTAAEQVDLTMRQSLAALLGENIHGDDDDFDYYDVFEWDKNPGVEQFYALALRNPYAFAVTFLPASTSWRDPPTIVDDADTGADETTEFEDDIADLEDRLDLWHYCKRADKLAGIGEFGILVLEFDDVRQRDVADEDGEDVNTDAFAQPVSDATQLTGLRPFSEASVDEVELGGPGSGRWGQPLTYDIDLDDEDDDEDGTVTQAGPDTMTVHHSRVIHIHSDMLLDDEVRGVPRQQPVYNNLIDIERVLGSAGQLAYRASAWGINVNIDKDYDLEDGGDELREALHRWEAGLENVLRTHGADEVQSLGGEEIDPSSVIDPNIEAIASQPYMPPQSVLKGNETGERATTQDLKDWYGRIAERRNQFDTPTIVRPVIQAAIDHGGVTEPQGDGFSAEWDPLHETSAKDESEIQANRATVAKDAGSRLAGYGTEEWIEFLETGEFPELPDAADAVEEMDLDQERAQMDGPEAPPAVADGGQETLGGDE